MLLNASIGTSEPGGLRGAYSLARSSEPLLDGFRALYGAGTAKLLALFAVAGLVASFHTIIFAFGRQIYSLSRAGYYPRALSLTHGSRKTPHVALFGGAALGLALILACWFALGAEAGRGGDRRHPAQHGRVRRDDLVRASRGSSFILLRRRLPDIERPYRSPLGVPGAAATVAIALVTLGYQLQDPLYRIGAYAALAWYLAGVLYFALVGAATAWCCRREEEFA